MLSPLSAAASQVDDYTNAIHRALSLVQFAQNGDRPSLDQAIQTLEQLPSPGQPEILRDLRTEPPDFGDALQRLSSLYAALQQHVDTPDPAAAHRALHDVLSMPRYAGLGAGPSIPERVLSALLGAIGRLLSWLGLGNVHPQVPIWIWLGLAALAILAVILWPLRSGVTFGGRSARIRPVPLQQRPSVDFFADADRLAASGDYVAAIRALAGGVAIRLSGERAWDQSPYTVRELFSRSDHPDALRPLLRSFEEASYGHRPLDREAYARAVEAAEPYRRQAA